MRRILHVDADAFYASIEQRDDPRLRGRPVAVGSSSARGVVATASYEARRFGVRSAMPSRRALELCPGLVFVPPRFEAYREVALAMRAVFARYTDLVEPLSLDEAYLDVTEPKAGPASGTLLARRIKAEILRETHLTVSAGVSYCKFLAKLASDMEKPDGLTVITPQDAERVITTLPVERIHGVGPRTAERMHALGIRTGGDLRRHDEEVLVARFGKVGRHYWRLARGIDDRPVEPQRERKSVSSEETFAVDRGSIEELERDLPALAADVARRCARAGVGGRSVTVKLKYADHRIVTRQVSLPVAVSDVREVLEVARFVLRTRFRLESTVRLLGVGVGDLTAGDALQAPLFPAYMLRDFTLQDAVEPVPSERSEVRHAGAAPAVEAADSGSAGVRTTGGGRAWGDGGEAPEDASS